MTVLTGASNTGSWMPGHVRALGYFSFWLNRQIFLIIGTVLPWNEPFYYRFLNILIHAIAATALYWLILELTERWELAAAGGALFLVHPIQTQAITYISQRFESLAAMFMFLSAAAYVRFRRTKVKWWAAGTALFGLAAALTKETAVTLPLWICLIEVVFFEGAARLRKYAVYLVGLGIILLIPGVKAFAGDTNNLFGWIPWYQYFFTQGPILTKYFELATWPRRQFLFYDFPLVSAFSWVVAVQWLFVLAVVGLGFYLLKRTRSASATARSLETRSASATARSLETRSASATARSLERRLLIGFGILSFFLLLLPVVLLPLPDLVNEHRLYPAFAGVAIAAAGCISAMNRKWAFAAIGLLVVVFGVKTSMRNSDWNDQIKFLELHRAAFPKDPQILTRLASYYYTSGYVNKSIELNLEARRYENRFNTYYSQQGHVLTAVNLSAAYLAKNNLQAAEVEARRAIAAQPDEPFAWRALGLVQLQKHEFNKAAESLRKYADLSSSPEAWQMLQAAASQSGDLETAKLAAGKLEILEKAASGQEKVIEIPKQYKSLAIFGMTLVLLIAAAWGVWTLWSAVQVAFRPPTAPALAEGSTKLSDPT
jgi:protein O-mannosyl-transferase